MTYLSLEVSFINLPLKNEQPSALKDKEKSWLDASCLLGSNSYIQNSWLHSIITQMDLFMWPITMMQAYPPLVELRCYFILLSYAQLAAPGINLCLILF